MSKQKWKKVRAVVEVTTCDPRLTEKRLAHLLQEMFQWMEAETGGSLNTSITSSSCHPNWQTSKPRVKQFSRVFAYKLRAQQDGPDEPDYTGA